jgi:hypothetical protein
MRKYLPVMVLVSMMLSGVFLGWQGSSQSESQFKNVQVLTDLTPDQLQDFMASMVESLGVKKCTFCHVQDKSLDETEHKVIARKFMKMVKELNEGIFKDSKEKVTCYTCHRGKEKPVNKPEDEKIEQK